MSSSDSNSSVSARALSRLVFDDGSEPVDYAEDFAFGLVVRLLLILDMSKVRFAHFSNSAGFA